MLKTLLVCTLLMLPLTAYEKPENITDEGWEEIQPYLVDETSSLKRKLDKIFSPKKRPVRSPLGLKFAGFEIIKGNSRTGIVIAKHPKLKGKIVKVFTDDSWMPNDWYNFLTRVRGAEVVRELIKLHEWEDEFTVPKKEIYVLPSDNHPPLENCPKKFFALIVDEVKMVSFSRHAALWQSNLINQEKLIKLFILLSEGGLIDSVYIDNIPMNKEGKITFLDTEHYHKGPIPYSRFDQFLSPDMRNFWIQLTGRG